MAWEFIRNHWRDGMEILILAIAIYQIFRAFRATRGARILVEPGQDVAGAHVQRVTDGHHGGTDEVEQLARGSCPLA